MISIKYSLLILIVANKINHRRELDIRRTLTFDGENIDDDKLSVEVVDLFHVAEDDVVLVRYAGWKDGLVGRVEHLLQVALSGWLN